MYNDIYVLNMEQLSHIVVMQINLVIMDQNPIYVGLLNNSPTL